LVIPEVTSIPYSPAMAINSELIPEEDEKSLLLEILGELPELPEPPALKLYPWKPPLLIE